MDRGDRYDTSLHGVAQDGDQHSGTTEVDDVGALFRCIDLSQLGILGSNIQLTIDMCNRLRQQCKEADMQLALLKADLACALAEKEQLQNQLSESRVPDESPLPPAADMQVNITDFCTTEMAHVRYLFHVLIRLADSRDENDEFIIKSAEYVVPVYYFLLRQCHLQDHSWCYHGNRSNFVRYWNMYVAGIQSDETRRQQLLLRADSFAVMVGKYRILKCHTRKWTDVYRSASRHRRLISAACNVRSRLRDLLYAFADV